MGHRTLDPSKPDTPLGLLQTLLPRSSVARVHTDAHADTLGVFCLSLFLYFFISLFLYFFISLFLYFFISLFLYFFIYVFRTLCLALFILSALFVSLCLFLYYVF